MGFSLNGKKILLFAPCFFNYEKYIKEEIEKQGGIVHLYDERNNPTALKKILLRKTKFLIEKNVNNFYHKVCQNEASFMPDYIVFINPESVNGKSLDLLRKKFSQSCFILYMWDSSKNKKIKQYLDKFDYLYSFDKNDAFEFDMRFLPLFYIPTFKEIKEKEIKYDISFVGTVHSDRAKIIYNLKEYCERNNLRYLFYLYVPGKFMYYLRLMTDKYVRKLKSDCVHILSLDKEKVACITANSRCVLDINHPKQTGLTMRTFEMLGQKKKLITTNSYVKEYDFYNSSNQIIIDRNSTEFNSEDMTSEFVDIPDSIYEKYELQNWIKAIFNV